MGRAAGSRTIEASISQVGARSAPAAQTTSPRSTSRQPMPLRLSATRWPASARSSAWSWTWTERTRTSRPAGRIRTRSPAATSPDQSVPVTTVPMPRSVNERSTCMRAGPPARARGGASSATRSSASSSFAIPSPRGADTGTQSISGASSATSPAARAGSARSALVMAATPLFTPSCRSTARCSRVWGMTPSSAATQSRNRSTPEAPATIVRTNRSWPGTSTSETCLPLGSRSGA
jgi:hypothetical protein